MLKHIFFSMLSLQMLISCNKILDTQPQSFSTDKEYYKTQQELESALAGVYNTLISTNPMRQIHESFNITDECYYASTSLLTGPEVYSYSFSHPYIRDFWRTLYQGISNANILIRNINANTTIPKSDINYILGEASFLRGYYYFLLVSHFGSIPLILSPVEDPLNVNTARSALPIVYEQIIADMQFAEKLVKTKKDWGDGAEAVTHITQTTVQGILARVYLRMAGQPLNDIAKYEDAFNYTKKIIDSNKHSLITTITTPDCPSTYAQIFVNAILDQYDASESMWETDFAYNASTNTAGGILGREINLNYTVSATSDTGYGYGRMAATGALYALYEATDNRRDWAISTYNYTTAGKRNYYTTPAANSFVNGRLIGKWRSSYGPNIINKMNTFNKNYSSINAQNLRYADVLLMFAEAAFKTRGRTTEALDAINKVRRRAYGKPIATVSSIDFTATYPADFMQGIQDERARELCFEGHRRNDLIRWGLYLSTMKAVISNPSYFRDYAGNAITFTGNATSATSAYTNIDNKHLLLPIPSSEFISNKLIGTQNPGW